MPSTINIPPTVTQTQEYQESSSDEDSTPKRKESFLVLRTREIEQEKEEKKKKAASKSNKTAKRFKQGVWYQKHIPERVQIRRKENNKKKARKLTAETLKKLKKGTLVKKDLIVLIGKNTQMATVFGNIVQKGRGGHWLVHFENDRMFRLKPSEFEFVSNDTTQHVLSTNKNYEIEIKDPKQDHMDTMSSSKGEK